MNKIADQTLIQQFERTLSDHFDKDALVEEVKRNPILFEHMTYLAMKNISKLSWRSAWMIYHTMYDNDVRLQHKIPDLIEAIANKGEGHQRELLKIIERMNLNDESEGRLFNICAGIWENPGKQSSLRHRSVKIMFGFTKKYMELQNEFNLYLQDHYFEGLSPGIKSSIKKLKKKLTKHEVE